MQLTNMDVSSHSSPAETGGAPLSDDDDELDATRPPSEASSQEWDNVTDPGTQTPVL